MRTFPYFCTKLSVMRLIIDAGSTKMGWILMDGHEVKAHFVTKGFNPNYSSKQDLVEICRGAFLPNGNIHSIHYYGTGCGSEQNCQTVKEVFQAQFPDAEIHVTHDLMAACHAALGHEKGIACILGTGSNSCLYDGESIIEKAVSLGYLVGDEGSGMHIGREVVRAYFYDFMPEELRMKFDAAYHLELKDFIHRLYHEGQPSRYLASFARFAGENQHSPFIRDLVKNCFKVFIDAFVLRYPDCKTLKISFIGSIAYHLQGVLNECMDENGLVLGEIMQSPAEGLIRYYGG